MPKSLAWSNFITPSAVAGSEVSVGCGAKELSSVTRSLARV